ncbi:hypothetical protein [Desulfonatronum thiodismutans]|uniref:hypothetical protein n=1 Tax=Desulfonatronum thiodismutans TaxID=159290 RepID=UPI0004ABD79B|nr:hypothetical protein [Desulfonatronum thiodismutans]
MLTGSLQSIGNPSVTPYVNAMTPVPSGANSLGGNSLNSADTVTISSEGRRAADALHSGDVSAAGDVRQTSSSDYPLEMYQIPGWFADYGFQVSTQLGAKGDWFAERHPQAAAASAAERTEYAELVRGHYQAMLAENDITGLESHYNSLILDQSRSESLRQEMVERVRGDARLTELIHIMGKSSVIM